MDIDKLNNYLVVKAIAHLVTKLNDQEWWSQVNTMWLHVVRKMSEGAMYNIAGYIVEQIIKEVRTGGKISFGVVLLSLVFMEIGVPDGPKEKLWEYPMENKSLAKRFSKYLCKGAMTDDIKQKVEKWYDRLRTAFREEWHIPKDLLAVVGKQVQFVIYQHFCIAHFPMKDGVWSPWCKFPYAFTIRYFRAFVHIFIDTR